MSDRTETTAYPRPIAVRLWLTRVKDTSSFPALRCVLLTRRLRQCRKRCAERVVLRDLRRSRLRITVENRARIPWRRKGAWVFHG